MNEKDVMTTKSNIPLGQLLVDQGVITPEQLQTALHKQEETGEMLGVVLLELGFVSEEEVFMPVLAGQYAVDYIPLKDREIAKDVIAQVPPKFASYYKIMPVESENNVVTIATTQPLDITKMDEIALVVNAKIKPVLSGEKEILEAIRKYYGVGAETIEQMMGDVLPGESLQSMENLDESDSEASISKFLNQILLEAYRERATDIHIEPFEDELQIRYRVDGVLRDAKVPSNIIHFKDAINSRIKILSNLNIAEKRKPQDGRFKVKVSGLDLDLRVSFLPTPYGESVVMRLLSSAKLISLKDLGLPQKEHDILDGLIAKPNGIIFITGPTGSGKTTTLYSCLSKINTEDKKVITIEDPIEYQLKGITQIQINPGVGLNFAQGLRSMLRHDPDIMMVGEVRDIETAEISIQVALTGHLVFSTLHTNDAASGVTRLIDMGVEPYLITSTVECFVAQRLVRVLCPQCKTKAAVEEKIVEDIGDEVDLEAVNEVYEAKGCQACNFNGYSGRQGIYEFLLMTDPIRQLIMDRATAGKIKEAAVAGGMKTLAQSGWEKVKQGVTTPQEVIRVTKEEE